MLTSLSVTAVSEGALRGLAEFVDAVKATVSHLNSRAPSTRVPTPVKTHFTADQLIASGWERALEPARCVCLASVGGGRPGRQVSASKAIKAIPRGLEVSVAFHASLCGVPRSAVAIVHPPEARATAKSAFSREGWG